MNAEKKSGSKGFEILLVVIGALFGFGGTWAYDKYFKADDKQLETLITDQSQQTNVLREGFATLVKTLNERPGDIQSIDIALSSISKQFDSLGMANSELMKNYNISYKNDPAPIPKLDTGKIRQDGVQKKSSIFLVNVEPEKELRIPLGDRFSRQIDSKNQISIVNEKENDGFTLLTLINGGRIAFYSGVELPLIGDNKEWFRLVYRGVRDNQHIFAILPG